MKTALITGVAGQDGYYLSRLLLEKGYEVHGLVRPSGDPDQVQPRVMRHCVDITDYFAVFDVMERVAPDEVYNLAAITHVGYSFDNPAAYFHVNTLGALNILEAVRKFGGRLYQASTSELFGNAPAPQNEGTRFDPKSPYGVAKAAAHRNAVIYRESFGVWACCGILFNHESPYRGREFVTQRIASQVARIIKGKQDKMVLGNLKATRDWGHAQDFVEGMWLMMQQDKPIDFVLATGESHTVLQAAELAFWVAGREPGEIISDPQFTRPNDVENLRGDASKAKRILGWEPRISFRDLMEEMVQSAIRKESNAPFSMREVVA